MSSPPQQADPKPPRQPEPENLADREVRNPMFRWLMHLGIPMTVSIVVHVTLLATTALVAWEQHAQAGIDVGEYEAGLTESLADQMDSAFEWPEDQQLEAPDETSLDQLDQLDELRDIDQLDASDLDTADDFDAGDFGLGEGEGGGILGLGEGAGEAGSGGFGSGFGRGRRIGIASMWGQRILANRIVYVIDYSGSITIAVDDLKRELKKSVGELKASQSFNVIIFFSTVTRGAERFETESFADTLQPAVRDVKANFFKWIERKAPSGATEPLPAIRRALSQGAEAILFFSDGMFTDPDAEEKIARLNRERTKIYCFLFDDVLLDYFGDLPPREPQGAARLRKVGEQNGGTALKIVTGRDLQGG